MIDQSKPSSKPVLRTTGFRYRLVMALSDSPRERNLSYPNTMALSMSISQYWELYFCEVGKYLKYIHVGGTLREAILPMSISTVYIYFTSGNNILH